MTIPIHQQVKDAFDKGGLQAAFRDVLGWTTVTDEEESFPAPGFTARGKKIASMLNGVVVFQFNFEDQKTVSPSLQKDISKAVGAKYAERLVIFETKETATWLWPKKTAGGALTHEKLVVPAKTLPLFLAQRLSALAFTGDELMRGVSIQQLREKLRGSFDTSTVTKKFYEKFKNQHQDLASSISGLTEEQAGSYATLLLNRLMFIYFLQKKEFLNKDPNYLRTCLTKVQELEQPAGFYNFYRDLLLVLFFEGLNKKDRTFKTPQIEKIIGDVPYVNGGIFGETEIEREHNIEVPDSVFENIFTFFDSFTWHLDTRPTGKSDEINPEVIGYIFEQYINFTAGGKKENGAYYTKQDVTGYMVGQTLVPKVLDILVENGLNPLALLPTSGDRYINESMLHGWSSESNSWLTLDANLEEVWLADPIGWTVLDEADLDPLVCLPGESWVEMFHRRDRVEALRREIESGASSEVNDLITLNLNSQLLLHDGLLSIDNEIDLKAMWERLATLSVIDPTCGSGAFLFAALEVLEDIYGHLIDVAEELSGNSEYAAQIVQDVAGHHNRRYFIRKKAALNNLYGTDLMPDAIETAKLRVFLALASCLDGKEQIEPLPDLDFNFKAGNLIVGIKDLADVDRISEGDLTSQLELKALEPLIVQYVEAYAAFIKATEANVSQRVDAKSQLATLNKNINAECDQVLTRLLFIPKNEVENWIEAKRPFHWFAEFPQIFVRGGFDVIVGNPPYVKRSESDLADFRGYKTQDAPDLFAICYERSLQLLETNGRHSFVVMLNLAFSGKLDSLRQVIANQNRSEWWSTYGKRPDSLFAGVQVVNTILVLGPGSFKASTSHQIFSKTSRPSMFNLLEYHGITRNDHQIPVRGGLASRLALAIRDAEPPVSKKLSGDSIAVRLTGRYWFPALPSAPKIIDSSLNLTDEIDGRVPKVELYESESKALALATLAGKLGYLWWSSTGDDFDTKESETVQPRYFALKAAPTDALLKLANLVLEAGYTAGFASQNAGWHQANIRWNTVRDKTDMFDLALLKVIRLDEEWRNLNIWYRQVMKSTGENNNGVNLPEELTRKVFQAPS